MRVGLWPEGRVASAPYRGTDEAPGNGDRVLRAGVRPTALSLGLSPRETQVADLLVRGSTIKSVAADLGISPNTVKSHLRRIHRKLGITNRAELCRQLPQTATPSDVFRWN